VGIVLQVSDNKGKAKITPRVIVAGMLQEADCRGGSDKAIRSEAFGGQSGVPSPIFCGEFFNIRLSTIIFLLRDVNSASGLEVQGTKRDSPD